jgi:hypothetical protein
MQKTYYKNYKHHNALWNDNDEDDDIIINII